MNEIPQPTRSGIIQALPIHSITGFVRECLKYRQLFLQFFYREVKGRYLGSISGFLWVFLQPVLYISIFNFVFSTIFKVRFPELEQHNFLTFVAVAMWPWLAFAESLQRATVAIQANADIVKKVSFPKEILVLASVSATYLLHLTGYLFILIMFAIFGNDINLLALPLVLLLYLQQAMLALALGFVLGAFNVFLRDLEHALVSITMLWFYVTPILYPVSLLPESMRGLMNLNPLTYYVESYRDILMYERWSYGFADLAVTLITFALLYFAWRLFRRCANRFEDFL